MKHPASFILLSLLASAASADSPPYIGCTALGCIGVPGSLYVNEQGEALVTKPDGMNTSALPCALSGAQYFTLKRSHAGFKEIYAMLLMANATQKVVFLRPVDGSAGCELMYAVVYP